MSADIKLSQDLGYLRISAGVPELRIADVDFNVKSILELVDQAREKKAQVVCFPEMSLTGYTLGDLVQHQALLKEVENGLNTIATAGQNNSIIIIIGAPLSIDQRIYNSAVVISHGRILGAVPKTFLPNYKEFYDERWFESGSNSHSANIELAGQTLPFGNDLLFKLTGKSSAILGVEICEDLWVPFAPHEYQSVAGANVLFNLSASNEVLGKDDWRRILISSESGRCLSAYCYISSSIGESTNDMIFGGHGLIAENGSILDETSRLCRGAQLLTVDVDVERLEFDRRSANSFQFASQYGKPFRTIEIPVEDTEAKQLYRIIDPHPFVPADASRRADRCQEIFSMQIGALSKKLSGAKKKKIVLGISGGLDSTLALLAAVKTMDFLELPKANVFAFTLPGYGTTLRTKNNATQLSEALGVTFSEISIANTCSIQLQDLEHAGTQDIVFENVQARYRTDFLFNKANELDAIMLGTGDLTEVALGWSTFAGDQVSHYHVNVSVPKTLVRYLIRWVAEEELANSPAEPILIDILETPISPELLKPSNGMIVQKSEDIIGPVELADFFLYPFIRMGMRPGKILFLANEVCRQDLFDKKYTLDELHKWFTSFLRRFFANQFKRTCMPEGPKVGSVSLSPRSDWRMPSDAEPGLWLKDLDQMYHQLKSQ